MGSRAPLAVPDDALDRNMKTMSLTRTDGLGRDASFLKESPLKRSHTWSLGLLPSWTLSRTKKVLQVTLEPPSEEEDTLVESDSESDSDGAPADLFKQQDFDDQIEEQRKTREN